MSNKIYKITLYNSDMKNCFEFFCDSWVYDFDNGLYVFIRSNNSDDILRETFISCVPRRVCFIEEVKKNE